MMVPMPQFMTYGESLPAALPGALYRGDSAIANTDKRCLAAAQIGISNFDPNVIRNGLDIDLLRVRNPEQGDAFFSRMHWRY